MKEPAYPSRTNPGRSALAFVLALLALILLTATTVRSATHYVSTTGDDQADGAFGTPWRTITHALDLAQPGDSIMLRGGEFREQVTTVRDGSDGNPIAIVGFANELVIIDGTNAEFRNGIVIAHDFINVIGVTVRNWNDTGIWLQPGTDHVLIRRCEVDGCGAGIDIYEGVHDFVIDSVDLHGFREESHGLDMTSHDGTPIYNGLISNSRSHDGGGGNCDGFALGHRGDGNVYASFGDVHDVRLVNCLAYNVGDGFDISGRNNILERCVSHDTYYGGNYKLWGHTVTLVNCIGYNGGVNVELDHFVPRSPDDPPGTPPPSVTMYNCTFFNGTSYNISLETDSCRLRMYNCIVVGGANIGMNFSQPFIRAVYDGDYNLFGCDNPSRMVADPEIDVSLQDFLDGRWLQISGQDAHSKVVVDPTTLFVDTNAASLDLHLRAGASAIDAGITIPGTTPLFDFAGTPRGELIDIGAYEFIGPSGVPSEDFTQRIANCDGTVSSTGIRMAVTLREPERVRVLLTDVRGCTRSVIDQQLSTGEQSLWIPTDDLATGVYWITLICASETRTCRLLVLG